MIFSIYFITSILIKNHFSIKQPIDLHLDINSSWSPSRLNSKVNPNYFYSLRSITRFHCDISRDKLLWPLIFKFLFNPNVKSGSLAWSLKRWMFFCSVNTTLAYILPLYKICREYKTSFSCIVKGRIRKLCKCKYTSEDILLMTLPTKDLNAMERYFRYHNSHQLANPSYFCEAAQEILCLPNLPLPNTKECPLIEPLIFFIF